MLLFIIGKICVYFPSLCAAIFAQFGFSQMNTNPICLVIARKFVANFGQKWVIRTFKVLQAVEKKYILFNLTVA